MRLEPPLDQIVSSSSRNFFHLPRSKGKKHAETCTTWDCQKKSCRTFVICRIWSTISNARFCPSTVGVCLKIGTTDQESCLSNGFTFNRKPLGFNCAILYSDRPVCRWIYIYSVYIIENINIFYICIYLLTWIYWVYPFPLCWSVKIHESGFTKTEGNLTWLASFVGMLIHPSQRLFTQVSLDFT